MASVKVLGADGVVAGTLELRPEVFDAAVRVPLLHQAVVRELADRRAGTHDTRGRSEVSGGGKKPWKQKGTGRARQGSIRATQWKGGGKPFGPTPRSYAQALPRKMRREALRAALSARLGDGGLQVVESLAVADGRTRSLVARLAALGGGADGSVLLVVAVLEDGLRRASRNLGGVTVETPAHVSVRQLLTARRIIAERPALALLEEALAR